MHRLAQLLGLSLVLACSGLLPVAALAAEASCADEGEIEDDCCGETCMTCACCPHRISSESAPASLPLATALLPGPIAARLPDLPEGSRPGIFHPPGR